MAFDSGMLETSTAESADLDWVADFGLMGSENVLSSFVAWALREHAPMRSWLLEHAMVDPSLSEHAHWRVVREWFVGGAGNVDIIVRNRALGWTFVIEHKIATRLGREQIAKYREAIEETRRCSGRDEVVFAYLFTPGGEPHKLDIDHDGTCKDAVQLDYESFVERARAIPAIGGSHVARCCLREMERLSRGSIAPHDSATTPAREQLLHRIAEKLGDGATKEGITISIADCTITVPKGARQCISLRFELPVARTGASAILDRAIGREDKERAGVTVSVPWPEPGMDAPWAIDLATVGVHELLEEQAAIVAQIVRAAGRAH